MKKKTLPDLNKTYSLKKKQKNSSDVDHYLQENRKKSWRGVEKIRKKNRRMKKNPRQVYLKNSRAVRVHIKTAETSLNQRIHKPLT